MKAEIYPIWSGQTVIGSVAPATLRPGQFFWSIHTGAMGYGPTALEAAEAAKKRWKQDVKDRRRRAVAHMLSTYNTRKKYPEKRFAKKRTLV